MEERKGFRSLLGAFPRVKERFPTARLIVAGGYTDDDIEPFRRQVSELGIQDVVFAGRVSAEEKPRYYRSCHVFCAPSTGFESQGIVLLEAMASGRALVASDIPGYRSVVVHGQEGLLVPPRDEGALAQALIEVLGSSRLQAELGKNGRLRAESHSWTRIAVDILNYYVEVRHKMERRERLREVLRAR
jgi:phosphatidylinositol alpha-mannosyltransferase